MVVDIRFVLVVNILRVIEFISFNFFNYVVFLFSFIDEDVVV